MRDKNAFWEGVFRTKKATISSRSRATKYMGAGLVFSADFQQILVHSGVFRGYKNILLRTNGFKDEIFLGKLMSENQLASKVEG